MSSINIDWSQAHIAKISDFLVNEPAGATIDSAKHRKQIEPWLSAIFQSDHLSLLIGSGLTSAACFAAGVTPQQMNRLDLGNNEFASTITDNADEVAKSLNRGDANIEDDIRVALEILTGLRFINDERFDDLKENLDNALKTFIDGVLKSERDFLCKLNKDDESATKAFSLYKSFILSFASRTASRERLQIFTTNYERFIELACDDLGVLLLDRFKGKLRPIFRNTRLELDYHYNPPGIRGEPRYVEGVAKITKLHGSIDWRFEKDRIVRSLLPFGADTEHPEVPGSITDQVVIYPNSSKDIETAFYPYAELFRDFSSNLCQPNSVLVTYGYGFGDSHINRVLEDMLTIPSTHLVIINWDQGNDSNGDGIFHFGAARDRIIRFLENKNAPQISLLIGEHFADLEILVDYYLPKAAIDRLSIKMQKLKDARGDNKRDDLENKPAISTDDEDLDWGDLDDNA